MAVSAPTHTTPMGDLLALQSSGECSLGGSGGPIGGVWGARWGDLKVGHWGTQRWGMEHEVEGSNIRVWGHKDGGTQCWGMGHKDGGIQCWGMGGNQS